MIISVRLQLSRKKGFNLQEHSRAINGLPAIICARPSVFGNPFKIGDPHPEHDRPMSREDAVEAHRKALFGGLLCYRVKLEEYVRARKWQGSFDPATIKSFLRGHNLACWCGPQALCHASTLLEIVNS